MYSLIDFICYHSVKASSNLKIKMSQNITWLCMKKDVSKRTILEDFLSPHYNYRVESFNVIDDNTEILTEKKFEAKLSVNIHTVEETNVFLKDCYEQTNTLFNKEKPDRQLKTCFSGKRKCHHKVTKLFDKVKNQIRPDRSAGKNTECPSLINFKLTDAIPHEHSENCEIFSLEITILWSHNHNIEAASAYKFLNVSEESKLEFQKLFDEGHTPSSAHRSVKTRLMSQYPNNYVHILSDRSVFPDYKGSLQKKIVKRVTLSLLRSKLTLPPKY